MIRLYFEHSKDQSFAVDYRAAGFVGGGGVWLLEAVYKNHSDYWANKWEVTNREAADQKIWGVKYGLIKKKGATTCVQYDVDEVKNELDMCLTEIKEFAASHNLEQWADVFEKAQNNLQSSTPAMGYYHKDLIVTKNYPLSSQQLLFSAGMAWVFGGMGSWNDCGFEDKDENKLYEDLSAKLYDNIIKAIIAVVNN